MQLKRYKQITPQEWLSQLRADGPERDLAVFAVSYEEFKTLHELDFEEYLGQLGQEASAFIECDSIPFWLSFDLERDVTDLRIRVCPSNLESGALDLISKSLGMAKPEWTSPELAQ